MSGSNPLAANMDDMSYLMATWHGGSMVVSAVFLAVAILLWWLPNTDKISSVSDATRCGGWSRWFAVLIALIQALIYLVWG